MDTCVDFVSDLFKPFLPDNSQVNPKCYGAELAWWLSRELAKRGMETSYPEYEDWGWFLGYEVDDHEYRLCCVNTAEDGSEWRVFLDPIAAGMFGRKKPPADGAAPLLKALAETLSDSAEVTDIVWSSSFP